MRTSNALLFASLLACALSAKASDAADIERGPYGFFPAKLAVQTNGDELTLRLSGTVPEVNYLLLARTNEAYASWFSFTNLLGTPGTNVSVIHIKWKPGGGTNAPFIKWGARQISALELARLQFTAGSGEDADGDGLPDLYEDLITHTDPLSPDTGSTGMADGYKDPDGDGWSNLQELNNGTDPLKFDEPPKPSNIVIHRGPGQGGIMYWQYQAMTKPESFTVFHKGTSEPDTAWRVAGEVKAIPDKFNLYEYVETNANAILTNVYGIRANYPAPMRAALPSHVDRDGILETMRSVICKPTVDGYEMTVANPVQFCHYLLLARDGKSDYWKASGFFSGGTNGGAIKLSADTTGMLRASEGPVLLPKLEHLANLKHPEFVCGSGEDADADGLPDIYEALVTKTDPGNSDTGGTGLMDGYKDLAGDGWTTLEKFRRRANPLAKLNPPSGIEMIEPKWTEVWGAAEAYEEDSQCDFKYDIVVETRTLKGPGSLIYHPIQRRLDMVSLSQQSDAVATNMAVRISFQLPERKKTLRDADAP